jgi:hypothetical protein
MGTTQYRNRALAVRGYRLVSVPWSNWRKASKDEQGQYKYLMQLFMEAGLVGGLPTATTCAQPPAAVAAAAGAGSTAKALAKALLRKGALPVRDSPQVRRRETTVCRCDVDDVLHVVDVPSPVSAVTSDLLVRLWQRCDHRVF